MQATYSRHYENDFAILPDQQTFIGVWTQHRTTPLIENIANPFLPVKLVEHQSDIITVIPNGDHTELLVGDKSGRLAQYGMTDGHSMARLIKDYGNSGVHSVLSGARIGYLVAVGGSNYAVKMVDMRSRRVLEGRLTTAIKAVESVKFCAMSESKVLLSISGKNPSYSDQKTDIFDVSELVLSVNIRLDNAIELRVQAKQEKALRKRSG